jgi:hypothetical protein
MVRVDVLGDGTIQCAITSGIGMQVGFGITSPTGLASVDNIALDTIRFSTTP